MPKNSRDLAVIAIHEAAHCIAAQMRGATVHSVTLEPGAMTYTIAHKPQKVFKNGVMVAKPKPRRKTLADAFIAYAGSWAQARCQALDVAEVLQDNITDWQVVDTVGPSDLMLAAWSEELEAQWERITMVAQRMLQAHMDFVRRRIRLQRKGIRRADRTG